MPALPVPADFEKVPGVDLKHLEFVSGLQVEEFSITPSVIKPLQKATITWKVSHKGGREVVGGMGEYMGMGAPEGRA